MIDYAELEKLDRCDVAYLFAITSMRLYRRTIEKITLFRKANNKGRSVTSITVYYSDPANNTHTQFFKLYDDEYMWFLNRFSHDFPEVSLEDLTAETGRRDKNDV